MNPMRAKMIRQSILEGIKHAQGYAIMADALASYVSSLLRPPLVDGEWDESIKWLLDGNYITPIESDWDKSLVQYAITERGKVLLTNL